MVFRLIFNGNVETLNKVANIHFFLLMKRNIIKKEGLNSRSLTIAYAPALCERHPKANLTVLNFSPMTLAWEWLIIPFKI